MPATVTLASTTLSVPCSATDGVIKVASTSGLTPGTRLFLDGELMTVVSLGVVDPWVNVQRGRDGTAALPHDGGGTIYIGRGDQFYESDPVGAPSEAIAVSPWINLRNGKVWFAQGDSVPTGLAVRWWQQQTATYSYGPLGVRVTTLDPTSST